MLRIIIISLVSMCSLFPFMMITTQYFGLNDDYGGVASIILGWIVLPLVLLKSWKVKPDLYVLPIDVDDPIMLEHIAMAKSKLERFFAGLNEGKAEAYIKFPYEFDDEIEHVWGLAHSEADDKVIVSLASDPIGAPGEEVMERVQVPKEKIEDWMLIDAKGKSQGGYTMWATAKIYKRDYGKLPKKYIREFDRFVDFSWEENA